MSNEGLKPQSDTRPKRTESQSKDDLQFCVDWFLKGYNYREIANKLNEHNKQLGIDYTLSHVQVFNDLRAEQARWVAETRENMDLYMKQRIEKLAWMENEAREAWLASKADKRTAEITGGTIDTKAGTVAGGTITKRKQESRTGEARYLEVLQKTWERQDELLGIRGITSAPPINPDDVIKDVVVPNEVIDVLGDYLLGIPPIDETPLKENTDADE